MSARTVARARVLPWMSERMAMRMRRLAPSGTYAHVRVRRPVMAESVQVEMSASAGCDRRAEAAVVRRGEEERQEIDGAVREGERRDVFGRGEDHRLPLSKHNIALVGARRPA